MYRQLGYCIKRMFLNVHVAEDAYHIGFVLHTKSVRKVVPNAMQKLILLLMKLGVRGDFTQNSQKALDL